MTKLSSLSFVEPRRLAVPLEVLTQAGADVADDVGYAALPHRLGGRLPPRLAHLAQIALEHQGAPQHEKEAGDADHQAGGEREHKDHQPGREAGRRPLTVAPGVPVQGVLADAPGEVRIALVELALDLVEDALLFFL